MKRGFTLIEIIIVIIIIGILAAVGISQYSDTVEKSRLAEAKARIGTMRQLVYQYYLEHGSLTGLTDADLGVDNSCHPTDFYRYRIGGLTASYATLNAKRFIYCGKAPYAKREYLFYMQYYPQSGSSTWYCGYLDDFSPCFGYTWVSPASY